MCVKAGRILYRGYYYYYYYYNISYDVAVWCVCICVSAKCMNGCTIWARPLITDHARHYFRISCMLIMIIIIINNINIILIRTPLPPCRTYVHHGSILLCFMNIVFYIVYVIVVIDNHKLYCVRTTKAWLPIHICELCTTHNLYSCTGCFFLKANSIVISERIGYSFLFV